MARRVEQLTKAQAAMIPAVGDEWLAHGLSTVPADRDRAVHGVRRAYQAAGLDPPTAVAWVGSPLAGCVGASVLLQVRGKTEGGVQRKVFGRLTDLLESTLRRNVERRTWDRVAADLHYRLTPQIGRALRRPILNQIWDDAFKARIGIGRATYPKSFGQHDADWLARHDYFGRICGLASGQGVDGLLEVSRSAGWWWAFADTVILAERPTALHRDDEGRLHNPAGPALAYPDGWALHAWHGTRVPAWAIQTPTVKLIQAEPNVEIRRCAIEALGWDTYLGTAGLREIAACPDPGNPGHHLRLFDVPQDIWGDPVRVLLVTNGSPEPDGSHRRYGLTVPRDIADPLAAAAWTYGVNSAQYAQLARRT
jgi:hypothetical protein